MKTPIKEIEESMKVVDLHPSLEEVVNANGLDRKKLTVGLKMKDDRPDLSNTSFLVDALKATGNGADSDAIQRGLVFVSRCQNLEGPHNATPFFKESSSRTSFT